MRLRANKHLFERKQKVEKGENLRMLYIVFGFGFCCCRTKNTTSRSKIDAPILTFEPPFPHQKASCLVTNSTSHSQEVLSTCLNPILVDLPSFLSPNVNGKFFCLNVMGRLLFSSPHPFPYTTHNEPKMHRRAPPKP